MQRHAARGSSPSQPAPGGAMSNPFANLNPNALANGQQAANTNGGFGFANTNGGFSFGATSTSFGATNNSFGATSNSFGATSNSFNFGNTNGGFNFGATTNASNNQATGNAEMEIEAPPIFKPVAPPSPPKASGVFDNVWKPAAPIKFGSSPEKPTSDNAINNEAADKTEKETQPLPVFQPAVPASPPKPSSVFDNVWKPNTPIKFGSSPEKPTTNDSVNNEAAEDSEKETEPTPAFQPVAPASPPKTSSVFENAWKPAGPITFGSGSVAPPPVASTTQEATSEAKPASATSNFFANALKSVESTPTSAATPTPKGKENANGPVFAFAPTPNEKEKEKEPIFAFAPTPKEKEKEEGPVFAFTPTPKDKEKEKEPIFAFTPAPKEKEKEPVPAITPTLKEKEKAPVPAITPTPKGKEKDKEPVDVRTFQPSNLPGYLNDDGRKQVGRAFKLRALNVEFKKRMAKIDPASSDLDALVRFYVACRENIGQSLGLYERVTAGSKRKAESSSDHPVDSAETPKRARLTGEGDLSSTPVSQPVSQPVPQPVPQPEPSTVSTSPTPTPTLTPQLGPSTPFFDPTPRAPSVFDHTWRPESPIRFASGSETPTPDDSGNEGGAEEAENEAQVSLMDSRPGEEHEEVLFEARAKLMKWDGEDKEWKSMGVGPFRILKHKETAKIRMVLRSDPNAAIILNSAVQNGITYKVGGDGGKGAAIKFADVTSTGSFESRILKVKTPELAQKVSEILEAAKSA